MLIFSTGRDATPIAINNAISPSTCPVERFFVIFRSPRDPSRSPHYSLASAGSGARHGEFVDRGRGLERLHGG